MDMNEFWECFDREERDFQGVRITAVYFDAIELDGLDFRNADFIGAQIRKSILRNCNFEGATFEAAHFERASFIGCQLSQANFVKATATELHFDDCDLSDATFIDSELGDLEVLRSNLRQSRWQNAWWCGSFQSCDLTAAELEGMSASSAEILDTIYPNGVMGSRSWPVLKVREPLTPEQPVLTIGAASENNSRSIPLQSSVGIDYAELQSLLQNHQWHRASEKTEELLLAITKNSSGIILEKDFFAKIPCIDLQTIDRLWIEYSWGRFGFSIQHQIWLDICGGYTCDTKKNYQQFHDAVKWSSHDFIENKTMDNAELVKEAAAGYYPTIFNWFSFSLDIQHLLGELYGRLSDCQDSSNLPEQQGTPVITIELVNQLMTGLDAMERRLDRLENPVNPGRKRKKAGE
jgi:hypothetical protein